MVPVIKENPAVAVNAVTVGLEGRNGKVVGNGTDAAVFHILIENTAGDTGPEARHRQREFIGGGTDEGDVFLPFDGSGEVFYDIGRKLQRCFALGILKKNHVLDDIPAPCDGFGKEIVISLLAVRFNKEDIEEYGLGRIGEIYVLKNFRVDVPSPWPSSQAEPFPVFQGVLIDEEEHDIRMGRRRFSANVPDQKIVGFVFEKIAGNDKHRRRNNEY